VRQQLLDVEGKPGRVFGLITNEYTSVDAMVGKAIRKGLKAIYDQVTGSEHSDQTDDVVDAELPPLGNSSQSKSDQLADRLVEENKAAAVPAPEQAPATPSPAQPVAEINECAEAVNDLRDRLDRCSNEGDFQSVSAELVRNHDRFGEEGYKELTTI